MARIRTIKVLALRVLTVRQPHAWQIIHEHRNVESRPRSLGPYRGLVAIHAGLTPDEDALRRLRGRPPGWVTAPRAFRYGVVLGVVNLIGAHHADECLGLCSRWAMDGHHHLVLAHPRPLPRPVPATGRRGLWRPDEDLAAAITEQIEGDAS